MSGQLVSDIQSAFIRAQRALELFQLSLTVYQAECQRGDFEAAELERLPMISSLESFLDEFATANRTVKILNEK